MRTDPNSPQYIDRFAVSHAKDDPVAVIMPALRQLADDRAANPHTITADGRPLRELVADPAYTRSDPVLNAYRALGADIIFRPHTTNQPPLTHIPPDKPGRAGWALIAGHPACPCCPPRANTPLPKPFAPQAELDHHHRLVDSLEPWRMKINHRYPDGSIQFRAPHTTGPDRKRGGCPHCINPDGTAVIDPDTGHPRPRCCTQPTKKFTAEKRARLQPFPVGSAVWYDHLNRRNPVEGTYGIVKNLALVNWKRDWHHLGGVTAEWITFGFAAFAYNWHICRSFEALARYAEQRQQPDRRPSPNTRAHLPDTDTKAARPARVADAIADLIIPGTSPPG